MQLKSITNLSIILSAGIALTACGVAKNTTVETVKEYAVKTQEKGTPTVNLFTEESYESFLTKDFSTDTEGMSYEEAVAFFGKPANETINLDETREVHWEYIEEGQAIGSALTIHFDTGNRATSKLGMNLVE